MRQLKNPGVTTKHSTASDSSPEHNYLSKQSLGGPSDTIKAQGCYFLMACLEAFIRNSHGIFCRGERRVKGKVLLRDAGLANMHLRC